MNTTSSPDLTTSDIFDIITDVLEEATSDQCNANITKSLSNISTMTFGIYSLQVWYYRLLVTIGVFSVVNFVAMIISNRFWKQIFRQKYVLAKDCSENQNIVKETYV